MEVPLREGLLKINFFNNFCIDYEQIINKFGLNSG